MNERAGKSSKPMVAGVLVVFLVAAFGAAFYFLGGVDLVSGFFGGKPKTVASVKPKATAAAKTKPAAKPAAKPAPTPVAATPTPTPVVNSVTVDPTFAKRMYIEQVESNENIAKLAAGDIRSFKLGKPVSKGSGVVEVPVTVTFSDKTSAPGVLGMLQQGGQWFLAYAGGMRTKDAKGEEGSISTGNNEAAVGDADHVAAFGGTIDSAVVDTIVSGQTASQSTLKTLAEGGYRELRVESVTGGAGTSTLSVKLQGKRSSSGRLVLIEKTIDGSQMWFVTSFNQK